MIADYLATFDYALAESYYAVVVVQELALDVAKYLAEDMSPS